MDPARVEPQDAPKISISKSNLLNSFVAVSVSSKSHDEKSSFRLQFLIDQIHKFEMILDFLN